MFQQMARDTQVKSRLERQRETMRTLAKRAQEAKEESDRQRKAMIELSERWREAREEAGLGINEVDYAMGSTSHGWSSPIERAARKIPSAYMLGKAADAMGVRKGWLAFGEEPKHMPKAFDRASRIKASTIVNVLDVCKPLAATIKLGHDHWSIWELAAVADDVANEPSIVGPDGQPTKGSWKERLDAYATHRVIDRAAAIKKAIEQRKPVSRVKTAAESNEPDGAPVVTKKR